MPQVAKHYQIPRCRLRLLSTKRHTAQGVSAFGDLEMTRYRTCHWRNRIWTVNPENERHLFSQSNGASGFRSFAELPEPRGKGSHDQHYSAKAWYSPPNEPTNRAPPDCVLNYA